METQHKIESSYGLHESDSKGKGLFIGEAQVIQFPETASLADGVALTTIGKTVMVGMAAPDGVELHHRVRGVIVSAATITAVAAGTDPAVDVYRHLPTPPAITGALVSPAAAGNVDNGAHDFAVEYVNAAGDTLPGPVVSITVTNKTVNGQVLLNIPIGPTGTTARKIIASKAGAHVLYVAATVANNTAETYIYNIADSSLSTPAATSNTAGQTILSETIKLSSTTRGLCDQPLYGTVTAAAAAEVYPGCMYSLRSLTGASSGAVTLLNAQLVVEFIK